MQSGGGERWRGGKRQRKRQGERGKESRGERDRKREKQTDIAVPLGASFPKIGPHHVTPPSSVPMIEAVVELIS